VGLGRLVAGAALLLLSFVPYWLFYGIDELLPGLRMHARYADISLTRGLLFLTGRLEGTLADHSTLGAALDKVALLWIPVLLALVVWCALRAREWGAPRLAAAIELSYLLYLALFSRTVYPWYLLWVLPFAWIAPGGRGRLLVYTVILFTLEVLLSFLRLGHATSALFYGLAALVAVVALLARRAGRRGTDARQAPRSSRHHRMAVPATSSAQSPSQPPSAPSSRR
jgi:hypothetical protein